MTSSPKRYTPGTRRTAWRSHCRGHRPSTPVGRQCSLAISLCLSLCLARASATWFGVLRRTSQQSFSPYRSFPFLPLPPFTTFRIRRGNSDSISLEGTMRPGECLYVRKIAGTDLKIGALFCLSLFPSRIFLSFFFFI